MCPGLTDRLKTSRLQLSSTQTDIGGQLTDNQYCTPLCYPLCHLLTVQSRVIKTVACVHCVTVSLDRVFAC
jgi:hypothetical protein